MGHINQLEETPSLPLATQTPFHTNERLSIVTEFVATKQRITVQGMNGFKTRYKSHTDL